MTETHRTETSETQHNISDAETTAYDVTVRYQRSNNGPSYSHLSLLL